jgi:MFS family permease
MKSVLANRDLRVFLLADALSLVGSGALWLALGIWAKSLTGSSAAAGMVIFAVLAPPVLLAPAAGMLVDRVRRRPLLVTVNLVTAAAVLVLLLVGDAGPVWLLYAVAAGYGASFAVLRSAQSALLRTLVTDDAELGAANGALQTLSALSRLLSPVAGAGLYAAVGPHSVVLLDAATFLVAAVGLGLLRVVEPAPAQSPPGSWRAEVGAGIVHLRRTVVLRQIVGAVSFAMLVVGFIEVLMFAVADAGLGRSPAFVGVLDLAFGAGAVAGGLLTGRLLRLVGPGRAVTTGLTLVAAGALLLVTSLVPVALAGMLVLGLGVPPVVAGMSTTLQRLTPAHLQGRTFSAVDVLVSTPQSLSIAVGAALIATVDHRLLLAAMTVGLLLAALYLGTRREQRLALDAQPAPDAPPTPDAQPAPRPSAPAARLTPDPQPTPATQPPAPAAV